MTRRLKTVRSLDDLKVEARSHLPRSVFAFVEAGAEDDRAHVGNQHAFARWSLLPRTLVDVSARDQSVSLFDRTYTAPFGIAPMGGAVVCARQADLNLAIGASGAGIPFVLSGASTEPLETVMEAAPGTWFQAYLSHDLARIDALLDRLERARVEVLVITTDVAVMGNRENALRAGFSLPPVLTPGLIWDGVSHPAWLIGTMAATLVRDGVPYQANFEAERGASILARKVSPGDRRSRLSWDHIRHIRKRWKGPLVLKGVLSAADAVLAQKSGVDGLVLSNHGGRQLASAVAPLDVLAEIRAAVPDLAILIDGGVRRGGDAIKAKALGADMVLVGRPFLYAVSLAGQAGVAKAAAILKQEVDRDLALLGCPRLGDIHPGYLRAANANG
jgi:L-lactate dehydrogenase (cytochrome)